jgi:hypothetical protein
MAKCKVCEREMSGDKPTNTCVTTPIVYNEKEYKQIPHGDKNDFLNSDNPRCHDCNVAKGGLHHPGCDAERCPICRGQIISCSCEIP